MLIISGVLLLSVGCAGQKEEAPETTTEAVTEEMAPTVEAYTITEEDLGTEVTCAVCGMTMTVTETTPALVFDDAVYYFCTADEMEKFKADPASFINMEETAEEVKDAAEKTVEKVSGH